MFSNNFISKRLQLVILGCMVILVMINFAILVGLQNNYNFVVHNYNQSRSNFDFISYLNDSIHSLFYNSTGIFYTTNTSNNIGGSIVVPNIYNHTVNTSIFHSNTTNPPPVLEIKK